MYGSFPLVQPEFAHSSFPLVRSEFAHNSFPLVMHTVMLQRGSKQRVGHRDAEQHVAVKRKEHKDSMHTSLCNMIK